MSIINKITRLFKSTSSVTSPNTMGPRTQLALVMLKPGALVASQFVAQELISKLEKIQGVSSIQIICPEIFPFTPEKADAFYKKPLEGKPPALKKEIVSRMSATSENPGEAQTPVIAFIVRATVAGEKSLYEILRQPDVIGPTWPMVGAGEGNIEVDGKTIPASLEKINESLRRQVEARFGFSPTIRGNPKNAFNFIHCSDSERNAWEEISHLFNRSDLEKWGIDKKTLDAIYPTPQNPNPVSYPFFNLNGQITISQFASPPTDLALFMHAQKILDRINAQRQQTGLATYRDFSAQALEHILLDWARWYQVQNIPSQPLDKNIATLIGPSGSGKTSVAMALSQGLVNLDALSPKGQIVLYNFLLKHKLIDKLGIVSKYFIENFAGNKEEAFLKLVEGDNTLQLNWKKHLYSYLNKTTQEAAQDFQLVTLSTSREGGIEPGEESLGTRFEHLINMGSFKAVEHFSDATGNIGYGIKKEPLRTAQERNSGMILIVAGPEIARQLNSYTLYIQPATNIQEFEEATFERLKQREQTTGRKAKDRIAASVAQYKNLERLDYDFTINNPLTTEEQQKNPDPVQINRDFCALVQQAKTTLQNLSGAPQGLGSVAVDAGAFPPRAALLRNSLSGLLDKVQKTATATLFNPEGEPFKVLRAFLLECFQMNESRTIMSKKEKSDGTKPLESNMTAEQNLVESTTGHILGVVGMAKAVATLPEVNLYAAKGPGFASLCLGTEDLHRERERNNLQAINNLLAAKAVTLAYFSEFGSIKAKEYWNMLIKEKQIKPNGQISKFEGKLEAFKLPKDISEEIRIKLFNILLRAQIIKEETLLRLALLHDIGKMQEPDKLYGHDRQSAQLIADCRLLKNIPFDPANPKKVDDLKSKLEKAQAEGKSPEEIDDIEREFYAVQSDEIEANRTIFTLAIKHHHAIGGTFEGGVSTHHFGEIFRDSEVKGILEEPGCDSIGRATLLINYLAAITLLDIGGHGLLSNLRAEHYLAMRERLIATVSKTQPFSADQVAQALEKLAVAEDALKRLGAILVPNHQQGGYSIADKSHKTLEDYGAQARQDIDTALQNNVISSNDSDNIIKYFQFVALRYFPLWQLAGIEGEKSTVDNLPHMHPSAMRFISLLVNIARKVKDKIEVVVVDKNNHLVVASDQATASQKIHEILSKNIAGDVNSKITGDISTGLSISGAEQKIEIQIQMPSNNGEPAKVSIKLMELENQVLRKNGDGK